MDVTDTSLPGLGHALSRLPPPLRAPARRALRRSIFEDGFALCETPEEVIVRSRVTNRLAFATYFVMHGGGFSFEFFLVRCLGGGQRLVVTRIYEFRSELALVPVMQ